MKTPVTFEGDRRFMFHEAGPVSRNNLQLFGAPGAIRTPDPLVRSQVLYPTELRAQKS